jgi:hypothetical protein
MFSWARLVIYWKTAMKIIYWCLIMIFQNTFYMMLRLCRLYCSSLWVLCMMSFKVLSRSLYENFSSKQWKILVSIFIETTKKYLLHDLEHSPNPVTIFRFHSFKYLVKSICFNPNSCQTFVSFIWQYRSGWSKYHIPNIVKVLRRLGRLLGGHK